MRREALWTNRNSKALKSCILGLLVSWTSILGAPGVCLALSIHKHARRGCCPTVCTRILLLKCFLQRASPFYRNHIVALFCELGSGASMQWLPKPNSSLFMHARGCSPDGGCSSDSLPLPFLPRPSPSVPHPPAPHLHAALPHYTGRVSVGGVCNLDCFSFSRRPHAFFQGKQGRRCRCTSESLFTTAAIRYRLTQPAGTLSCQLLLLPPACAPGFELSYAPELLLTSAVRSGAGMGHWEGSLARLLSQSKGWVDSESGLRLCYRFVVAARGNHCSAIRSELEITLEKVLYMICWYPVGKVVVKAR